MLRYAFMSALVMAAIMLVPSGHARSADELVVYSGRKENAIKPVVEAFQKQTGIAVRLKTGPTSGLANEIIQEKTRPLGDVFIATEVGVMEILSKKDVLEPYFSPAGRDLGPGLRATHGRWTYGQGEYVWVSTLSWGWVTFHYGRWMFSGARGWAR